MRPLRSSEKAVFLNNLKRDGYVRGQLAREIAKRHNKDEASTRGTINHWVAGRIPLPTYIACEMESLIGKSLNRMLVGNGYMPRS
jgi:hypothetical protein